MSHLEPPSDLLARALQAESSRPAPPASVRDHVLVRVVTTATIAAASAGAAIGAAKASGIEVGSVAGRALRGSVSSVKTLAVVVSAFVSGGATGAAIHAAVTVPATVVVAAPSAAPSMAAPTASTETATSATEPALVVSSSPSVQSMVSARAPASSAVPARSVTNGPDTDLSAERAMIERARTALMRGDAASALSALEVHARDYPRGRLAQEREVLTIQALIGAGRRADAQRRADRFRRDHPDSPLLAAIDAVLPPAPMPSPSASQ